MKYPRTYHIKGSLGKEDPDQVDLDGLPGDLLVIEEKLDGTQLSLRFEGRHQMVFQSRGTILTGGPQEAEFAMFKPWAHAHSQLLWELLGRRYIMYGEWLYGKHTVFYDALPHYFLEFDVWDKEETQWLSTTRRHELLKGTPVVSVPVLYQGPLADVGHLHDYMGTSLYRTEQWKKQLQQAAKEAQIDAKTVLQQTEQSRLIEGLYLKSETTTETLGRYKFIRKDFLHTILSSQEHWRERPLLPNRLADGVDLYSGY